MLRECPWNARGRRLEATELQAGPWNARGQHWEATGLGGSFGKFSRFLAWFTSFYDILRYSAIFLGIPVYPMIFYDIP